MTIQHRRWKPQGRAHRARLAHLLLPTLTAGDALPTGTWLGHWLGINPSEASRHLHRMLTEAGVRTETRGRGRCQRVYVVGMGYNGNAGQGMVPTGVSREQRDEQDREVPAVDHGQDHRGGQDPTPAVGQGASPDQSRAGSRPSDSLQDWRAAA